MKDKRLLVLPVIFEGGGSHLISSILLQRFKGVPLGHDYFLNAKRYIDTGKNYSDYVSDAQMTSLLKDESNIYRIFSGAVDSGHEKFFYPLYLTRGFEPEYWNGFCRLLQKFYRYASADFKIRSIFWIRNPMDAVYKLKDAPNANFIMNRIMAHFNICDELMECIPSEERMIVRYEDFCDRPYIGAKKLKAFLGLGEDTPMDTSHIYRNPISKFMSDQKFCDEISKMDILAINQINKKYGYPEISFERLWLKRLNAWRSTIVYSARRAFFYEHKKSPVSPAEINAVPVRSLDIAGRALNRIVRLFSRKRKKKLVYKESFTFKYHEQIDPLNKKYKDYA